MTATFNIFSSGGFLWVVFLWAIIIFVTLKLLKKYLPVVLGNYLGKDNFLFYFSIAEALVWGVFLLLVADVLVKKNLFIGIAFLVFLILLAAVVVMFYFKDYLSGLVIKMERGILPGDMVVINNVSGTVKKLNVRSVEIETGSGEVIIVPYHKLSDNFVVVKKKDLQTSYSHSFDLQADVTGFEDLQELKNQITAYLLGLPWIKPDSVPDIEIINRESGFVLFKITISPVANEFVYMIENSVRDRFGIKDNEEKDE